MTTRILADEAFGTDMYRLLADTPDLVFSPASVAAALRMALCGARGQTAAELSAALHMTAEAHTADQAADGLRRLDELVAHTPDGITFRVANTAWVQSGLPLRPDFTARFTGRLTGRLGATDSGAARLDATRVGATDSGATRSDTAGTDAARVGVASPNASASGPVLGSGSTSAIADADFAAAPEAARQRINEAIAEQTAGKITDLLAPGAVGALTRLVLANALYMKAPWAEPFPEQATADAPFHPSPGQSVTVPMMRGRAEREYVRGDGYQAVLLPYRASRLAMAIVLPDGSLSDLLTDPTARPQDKPTGPLADPAARPLDKPTTKSLGGLLDGAATHLVSLSLPRFRVTTELDLGPLLRRRGVTTAFTPDADFTGITGAERLHIGAAVHKAYIDVDEHGTEAAAATALAFRVLAARKPPPSAEMVVDRPFLFAVIDSATGLPLFLGQVTRPAG